MNVWEGAVAMRRDAFEYAGGWPEPFWYAHEGIELAWRVWDGGCHVRYDGEIEVLPPGHPARPGTPSSTGSRPATGSGWPGATCRSRSACSTCWPGPACRRCRLRSRTALCARRSGAIGSGSPSRAANAGR